MPYFLRILLTVLSDIVALQPDMNSVHTYGTENLLFALEILFIILSILFLGISVNSYFQCEDISDKKACFVIIDGFS